MQPTRSFCSALPALLITLAIPGLAGVPFLTNAGPSSEKAACSTSSFGHPLDTIAEERPAQGMSRRGRSSRGLGNYIDTLWDILIR